MLALSSANNASSTGTSLRMQANSPGIRDRLARLVTQAMGPGSSVPEPFPGDRRLVDLGITSLALLNLMLALEAEFDITIPQSEITMENLNTLSSIQSLLERIGPSPSTM